MTPKEKAEELLLKYLRLQEKDSYNWFNRKLAKQCALIAVEEVIKQWEYIGSHPEDGEMIYWQKVKQEIENL